MSSMPADKAIKPVTSATFQKMKKNDEKITMLTAYDYATA